MMRITNLFAPFYNSSTVIGQGKSKINKESETMQSVNDKIRTISMIHKSYDIILITKSQMKMGLSRLSC